MSKKPSQSTLFPIEGHVASRESIREVSRNSDHLRKINISLIRIRPDFNPRSRTRPEGIKEELWETTIMIPDLADKIWHNGGPAQPILGDIHEDGYFYITDGERRYRSLRLLIEMGREKYPDGKTPVSEVVVLLNPPGTTDRQRKMKAYNANDNLQLSPMQVAYHYLSFKTEDGLTDEQIAQEFKVSRQTVNNYIICATELPQDVREKIDSGELKITNALNDYRRAKRGTKDDGEPIITGKLADDLEKEEKEKEKLRGDEDEFEQEDNSVNFAGSRSLPEDKSSGAVVLGKDSIYMLQQRKMSMKQFINRYNHLMHNATLLITADLPGDEEDEERAAILFDRREAHVIDQLINEYDITVK